MISRLKSVSVLWAFCSTLVILHAFDPAKDLLISEFEGDDFGDWTVTGDAFSKGPARMGVRGFSGSGFAGSHLDGYRPEGTLTSPEFSIEKPYINFLLAGGNTSPIYVALLINGTEVNTAAPRGLDRMIWTSWDVGILKGQVARFKIIDDRSGHPEGYLFVDSIWQSERAMASPMATRTLNEEILTAFPLNPDPGKLPGLGVWRKGKELYVLAAFPEVSGFICDSWCYEIHDCEFIGAAAREGGVVELIHRVKRGGGNFRFLTKVIPTAGAVEFVVLAVADEAKGERLPQTLPIPNLCFQLRRAEGFRSDRSEDRKHYPEFVARCFIFTERGRTFLNDTDRQQIPVRPESDRENNPPWVQNYVAAWKGLPKADPTAWAGTSFDRYTVPVIGTVSVDGKYLVALADDSAELMCQAWHDCLHSRAQWQPTGAPPAEQTWRLKVYVMENDPEKLLNRVREDFPGLGSGLDF